MGNNISKRVYLYFRIYISKICFSIINWLRKEYRNIVMAIICGLIITKGITLMASNYSQEATNELSNNLIRFHVVANSDTVEDQQLKEHVRDVILEYMAPILSESKSIEQTRILISGELINIEQLAKDTINKWNKPYDVYVTLDKANFPTKQYGDIILPAGEYQACRIIIGEGKGKNWWCVMFPPLCYVDITHGIVPSQQKEQLKKVIPDKEYKLITQSSSSLKEDMPIKFKFKIIEVFNKKKSDYQVAKTKKQHRL